MNKSEVYAFLDNNKVWHEITEHGAVYNMAELENVELPYPDRDAKNLFVRDDKRREYYLITVKGDKRVDLKQFRRDHGTRPLTFASPEELQEILGLIPGAVTPLGTLNDKENRVVFYMDGEFLGGSGIIGIHPNDNTATVWLKADDLVKIIKDHGTEVNFFEI